MSLVQLARRLRAVEKRAAVAMPDRLTDEQIITAILSGEFAGHALDDLYDIFADPFKRTVLMGAFLKRLARIDYGANNSPALFVDTLTDALPVP